MVDEPFISTKLLIIGKTYPNHSVKYRETACTGAMRYDTFQMLRIYPIPYRYLEGSDALKPYQIITADLQRDLSDPRPESHKIRFKSIQYERRLGRAEAREHLERSPHLFRSVEELRERSRSESISLGIVRPREIVDVWLEPRSETERENWAQKEFEVTQQLLLFGEPSKPLDFPEAKFFVSWRCDDPRCTKPHEMSLHQWGIHELYRKLRPDPEGGEKIRDAMRRRLDLSQREVYFFLGTFRAIQNNFGLMDAHDFSKTAQLTLGLSVTEEAPDEWWR